VRQLDISVALCTRIPTLHSLLLCTLSPGSQSNLMDLEYLLIRSRFDLSSGREHILTIHGCSSRVVG